MSGVIMLKISGHKTLDLLQAHGSKAFRGMLLNILVNVAKQSGNVLKYLGERWQIFWKMPPNILTSVLRYSGECLCYSRG